MSWSKASQQDLAGEPERVRQAALRYLGRREYTAVELRRRLQERGAAAADIEAALRYAQERGYQDDARAAESHIRQRLAYAPRGRSLVRQELRERGLPEALVREMLEQYYPPEAEQELLQRLLAKQARLEAQLPPGDAAARRKRWQQMARRLTAKGFPPDAVFTALDAWLSLADADEFMD